MDSEKLPKMKIHEKIVSEELRKEIIRVQGGWLYSDYDLEKKQPIPKTSLFIAEEKKMKKESSDHYSSIDYNIH